MSEEDDYTHTRVPPKRTFTVPTRYVFRGRGKPLPYTRDLELAPRRYGWVYYAILALFWFLLGVFLGELTKR